MSDTDDQLTHSSGVLDRPRLFEEVRGRLSAITDSLSDFKMGVGQLRTTTHELVAVVHRIEWLADVSTPPPFKAP
jgi:hypothetical protein